MFCVIHAIISPTNLISTRTINLLRKSAIIEAEDEMALLMKRGGPYPPQAWSLGGTPVKHIDIPITAVFLVIFVLGAAMHMTIFQLNKRRGHKFLFSVVLFGFCMARITTCILRIASTSLPTDLQLAIAAQIFVAAGVLLIFIINLLWTQRIVRSLHPDFGWHRAPSIILKIIYVLIGLTLAVVITATVQSVYTLRPRTRTIDRSLQLYSSTFLAIISFLPLPILLISLLIPRTSPHDKFGHGRLRTKTTILLVGSTLVCVGAAYRCGTSWLTPVPRTQPLPGYLHKACFYIFNFGLEVVVVYLYGIMRVDLRFHVPDGARGKGSYAKGGVGDGGVKGNMEKEREGEGVTNLGDGG